MTAPRTETEAIREISRLVDARRDEIVDFAAKLVQIRSETGHEAEIQEFLAASFRSWGLAVHEVSVVAQQLSGLPGYEEMPGRAYAVPNVVAILEGDSNARSLLLNGHVDTVPSEPVNGWSADPLSGAVVDGQLFGRGSSDMKGGLAAMAMAMKVLLELGRRPRGTVVVECVVDEEVTGYGTLACIAEGYRADAAICCETSDLQVVPACIGRLWFTIELRGKPAGIASKWLGVSAIDLGLRMVQAVKELEQVRLTELGHPLFPDLRAAIPCEVCVFQAGSHPSTLPDHAVLKGSLGVLPSESVEDVKQAVRAQVQRAADSHWWLRREAPKLTFKDVGADGAEIPSNHPIVETVKRAFRAATGEEPVVAGRPGGSDSRYLIKYGNIPTVIFGPGVTAKMHAVDESLPLKNLITATKTIAIAIDEWCR